MTSDPFIIGLEKWFEDHPGTKPATVGAAAGLSKSTIRKMISTDTKSPRRDTAERIAAELGMTVEQIIAYGRGEAPPSDRPTAAGFAETASAFIPATRDAGAALETFLRSEHQDAGPISMMVLPRAWPALSLRKGDIVALDQSDLTPKVNALMLYTQQRHAGSAATIIRINTPQGAVLPYDETAGNPDDAEVFVGTIIASIRLAL